MSRDELSRGEENKSFHDSLNYVTAAPDTGDGCELIAEYLHRSDRLRRHERLFFKRLCFTNKPRPLPAQLIKQHCDTVVHESLALELSKSILYDNGESIDLKNLKSLNSHGDSKQYSQDSLWNGKPQQYFESMIMDDLDGMIGFVSSKEDYESDSLAQ